MGASFGEFLAARRDGCRGFHVATFAAAGVGPFDDEFADAFSASDAARRHARRLWRAGVGDSFGEFIGPHAAARAEQQRARALVITFERVAPPRASKGCGSRRCIGESIGAQRAVRGKQRTTCSATHHLLCTCDHSCSHTTRWQVAPGAECHLLVTACDSSGARMECGGEPFALSVRGPAQASRDHAEITRQ